MSEVFVEHRDDRDDPVVVLVSALRVGPSLRAGGIDPDHVASLAGAACAWPPVVVDRGTMTVIDGAHRLAAAKVLGHDTIEVRFFDGTPEEAYAEGIRCNVLDGLPLTLTERKAAARGVLTRQPDRSDRSVAALCGLAPSTVRSVRSRLHAAGVTQLSSYGRRHPVNADLHASIEEVLRAEPELSLRSVARRVGASPETVRSVRKRLSLDAPNAQSLARVLTLVSAADPEPARQWRHDSACASTPVGAEFAAWFDAHEVCDSDWVRFAESIPLSRVYEVVDDARRRARVWEGLARSLERRVER